MKRSQPRREWSAARAKVEAEGRCRLAYAKDCDGPLEAAHIIEREVDKFDPNGEPQYEPWVVYPIRIIPLCRRHHAADHSHEVDTLPILTRWEQSQAAWDAGGIELARIRTCPSAYRDKGIKAHGQ